MAKSRPSMQKRRSEARKLEKQQAKAQRKAQRENEQDDQQEVAEGVDPDIAGIVPGPQPSIWEQEQSNS